MKTTLRNPKKRYYFAHNTDKLYSKLFDDIFIEKNMLDFMAKCYVGRVELDEKYVSPINAKQDFSTSIYVFTAGKDPIQNDGKRLVEMRREPKTKKYIIIIIRKRFTIECLLH